MRTKSVFLGFAGLELARYFMLSRGVAFLAGAGASPQVMRFLAAPNLLLVVAFFFLGIDAARYEPFRRLILIGKALALFSAALALPGILASLGGVSAPRLGDVMALGAVMLWDLAAAVATLLIRSRPDGAQAKPAQGEPFIESVEAD